MNAFQAADNVLRQGVESISALINVPASSTWTSQTCAPL